MHQNNGITILSIDDEEVIRESIEAYLEDSGYTIIQAENGRVGLEVFRNAHPDLVLVDLRMPEVDGLDVLAKVTSERPLTPIIVVSGTGVLHDAIEALRLGAWDYVTKPIQDMAVLEHAVVKALERAELLQQRDQYQTHLESEVARRTAELTAANQRLEQEVTERERAQEQIRKSLDEKEVMLKEIHHRVKNNLQIISSLLYLQSQQIEDPGQRELFMQSRDRVRSMALVHEKLYQSGDLARIDYKNYLETITKALMQTYRDQNRKVRLDLDLEQIFIPVDSAIPCSLLVNELLTNSMKHAFTDRATGTICLSLRQLEGGVQLKVSDDGIGFPQGLDYRQTETLGMQLVVNLVGQLRGEIQEDFTSGTTFIITFPL
ncbi:sensor histidine kinase [Desulfovibrio ferrophilus]|uniref:histidine kinase n=1 Tax=Desulfovibrio ferrophilus TaxID=241368 RepID=A0A2Z6AZJ2_9BACT|nr:histidine kinase dimerization/phosphoacceptor domain -containing protein [Desulfovibrio ferrophilus]BBD08691.1 signal transduction histidine kinase [Desulfovibrio ferrophilus]